MGAEIQIGGLNAFLSGWRWLSENSTLERLLNSMLDPNGPSPSDPQPQINEARRVVEELGGKVIREIPFISEPDLIY